MPNRYINPIFATPFYSSEIETNAPLIIFIKSLSYMKTTMNNGWISETESLLDLPQLKDLRKKIQTEVDHFGYTQLNISENVPLNIIRSWSVKHNQKDYAQSHCHTNCLFSGILYLEVNSNSGDITFEGSSCFQTSLVPDLNQFNQFTSEVVTITPKNKDFFLFPSYLRHSVSTNTSANDRYCLSFDVGI